MPFVLCPSCRGSGIIDEQHDPLSMKLVSEICPICEGSRYITEIEHPDSCIFGNLL